LGFSGAPRGVGRTERSKRAGSRSTGQTGASSLSKQKKVNRLSGKETRTFRRSKLCEHIQGELVPTKLWDKGDSEVDSGTLGTEIGPHNKESKRGEDCYPKRGALPPVKKKGTPERKHKLSKPLAGKGGVVGELIGEKFRLRAKVVYQHGKNNIELTDGETAN